MDGKENRTVLFFCPKSKCIVTYNQCGQFSSMASELGTRSERERERERERKRERERESKYKWYYSVLGLIQGNTICRKLRKEWLLSFPWSDPVTFVITHSISFSFLLVLFDCESGEKWLTDGQFGGRVQTLCPVGTLPLSLSLFLSSTLCQHLPGQYCFGTCISLSVYWTYRVNQYTYTHIHTYRRTYRHTAPRSQLFFHCMSNSRLCDLLLTTRPYFSLSLSLFLSLTHPLYYTGSHGHFTQGH